MLVHIVHCYCIIKQLHLKQQAGERAALEAKKRIALCNNDENGNPTLAVIFGDGMTAYAGRTPKYGRRAGKNDSALFQNRVFGLHVYCGPINGEILIHTDELVRGGANFMVEVQRRGEIQHVCGLTFFCQSII